MERSSRAGNMREQVSASSSPAQVEMSEGFMSTQKLRGVKREGGGGRGDLQASDGSDISQDVAMQV